MYWWLWFSNLCDLLTADFIGLCRNITVVLAVTKADWNAFLITTATETPKYNQFQWGNHCVIFPTVQSYKYRPTTNIRVIMWKKAQSRYQRQSRWLEAYSARQVLVLISSSLSCYKTLVQDSYCRSHELLRNIELYCPLLDTSNTERFVAK